MADAKIPLEEGKFYHIYNRGIDGTNIFRTPDNYTHFLNLYAKHCEIVVETYAYCLLGNHFHLLIRVRENLPTYAVLYPNLRPEQITEKSKQIIDPARQFSHFFNAYAQSFNKATKRTSSLFEENFERKCVNSDSYFSQLVYYIHANPQKHGFVSDFRDYPYSSYHSHLSQKSTKLERESVLSWFGDKKDYTTFHSSLQDLTTIEDLMIEFD